MQFSKSKTVHVRYVGQENQAAKVYGISITLAQQFVAGLINAKLMLLGVFCAIRAIFRLDIMKNFFPVLGRCL